MTLIDDAIARREQRVRPRPIDYERMKRAHPKHKAALTRAVKTRDPERVARACVAAIAEWEEIGAWPDDWARWQRALDEALPFDRQTDLRDL